MTGWLVTCLNKLLGTRDLLYVTVHLVEGGGQHRFGEMRSYLQWEYSVRVFQRQHSLQQCVPKETRCTEFWLLFAGKREMSLIQHTVLKFMAARGKCKRSLQSHIRSLKFKFIYCAGDKIEKNEMGWACGAYG